MNFLDLFAGIGGFSLGAEWAGIHFDKHFFSEVDDYAIRVYRKRFPDAVPLGDIRGIRGADLPAGDWIIAGGFPCQDISVAGKGAGLEGSRSGLWYEYARIIGELRPSYAIMENVGALAFRGLDSVLGSLAALGYDAEWQDIRASDVGAPHRRERIWIVAYPGLPEPSGRDEDSQRLQHRDGRATRGESAPCGDVPYPCDNRLGESLQPLGLGRSGAASDARCDDEAWALADAEGNRRESRGPESKGLEGQPWSVGGGTPLAHPNGSHIQRKWIPIGISEKFAWPWINGKIVADTSSIGCSGPWQPFDASHQAQDRERQASDVVNERITNQWAVEPNVGRVANGIPARVDRLKCLGNSIVPHIAALIFAEIKKEIEE